MRSIPGVQAASLVAEPWGFCLYVAVMEHEDVERGLILDIESKFYPTIVESHVTAHQGRGVETVLPKGIRLF